MYVRMYSTFLFRIVLHICMYLGTVVRDKPQPDRSVSRSHILDYSRSKFEPPEA